MGVTELGFAIRIGRGPAGGRHTSAIFHVRTLVTTGPGKNSHGICLELSNIAKRSTCRAGI